VTRHWRPRDPEVEGIGADSSNNFYIFRWEGLGEHQGGVKLRFGMLLSQVYCGGLRVGFRDYWWPSRGSSRVL
jgi:hypothetical protein